MKVSVKYMAQIKQAAGVPAEDIELPQPCSAHELIHHVAEKHGDALRRLLLDADGQMQQTILLFVNDSQSVSTTETTLHDGDEVTFLSPIAGGIK